MLQEINHCVGLDASAAGGMIALYKQLSLFLLSWVGPSWGRFKKVV